MKIKMRILKKLTDKDFKILNLTDPQLSDQEWRDGRDEGRLLKDTVTYLVNKVKPDLITISGDLAWAGHYESYSHLADLLDRFCIPWAPVFGNHDNQGGRERVERAASILCQSRYCLLEQGDPKLGYGNYVVGIEEDGRLLHAIIFMDSHDRKPLIKEDGEEIMDWAELIPEQFVWYRETIANLKSKGVRETSLIMHIPLYTYRDAIHAALKDGIDPATVSPANGEQVGCWNEGYEDSFGVMYEGICSYSKDNGFFEEIYRGESTKTVLCGHDHTNTFSVRYRGIRLMYGMKTGAGCYWNKQINGGTVLTIGSDGHMEAEHCFFVPPEGVKPYDIRE